MAETGGGAFANGAVNLLIIGVPCFFGFVGMLILIFCCCEDESCLFSKCREKCKKKKDTEEEDTNTNTNTNQLDQNKTIDQVSVYYGDANNYLASWTW